MKGVALLLICVVAAAQARVKGNRKLDIQSQSPTDICAGEDSEDLILESEYCDQYYICNHGKAVLMPCPPYLLWYQTGQFCVWYKNQDCGNKIKPDWLLEIEAAKESSEELTGPAAICANPFTATHLTPHEENCNQFYKCDHGKPVLFDCPDGLVFSPEEQECDWPEKVQCGKLSLPDKVIV